MLVSAPFGVGSDITTNGVCCGAYRNPPHQKHVARPLPDQSLEVHVLLQPDSPSRGFSPDTARGTVPIACPTRTMATVWLAVLLVSGQDMQARSGKDVLSEEGICVLQPQQINITDIQAPKALWHEDTRGRDRGLPRNPHNPQSVPMYNDYNQVGALSSAAHRMLNNSLAAVNMNGNRPRHGPPPQVNLNPYSPLMPTTSRSLSPTPEPRCSAVSKPLQWLTCIGSLNNLFCGKEDDLVLEYEQMTASYSQAMILCPSVQNINAAPFWPGQQFPPGLGVRHGQ